MFPHFAARPKFRSLAPPSLPNGGFLGLTVKDTTPIDPQSSIGASGSGWVASVVLKGLTSLTGTIDATALTLNVTDPGFDTAGNVATVSRTIHGVAPIRRQYPNGNSKMINTDGTNLTVLISLDDWVYSGTTIVSAQIGSTFYTGCAATTAVSKVNLSATGYQKALFAWINPQQDLSGASYNVECVAFHRHATNGQQAACIKFSASDGTATSPVVTTSATFLSSRITQGNIPEVWKASLDMSSLAQATMATVNAKVYPWIGDSSAVLDLSVDGAAWPTALAQTKLRVFNDRTGGYGGAFAYVKNGASGGTVSTTAATARAAPYPTIEAALNAIQTFNNANKGHNDFGGGTVRIMDSGSATTITINGAPNNAYGATWCNIEKDPAATFSVTITWGSQQQWPQMIRWRGGLVIAATAARTFLGMDEASGLFCWDGITIGTSVEITWHAIKYLYNVTATGQSASLNGFPGSTYAIACAMGFSVPIGTSGGNDISSVADALCMIGNRLPDTPIGLTVATYGDDGRIFYNNTLYSVIFSSNNVAKTFAKGVANVQNLYETDNVLSNIAMNFFADGDTSAISNYIDFHNTAVGDRCSRMYNDVAGTMTAPNGCVKMGVSKYTIIDNYNLKSDTHIANGGFGAPGNWSYSYNVGNVGNVSLFGSLGGQNPTNDNSDNYMGNAWLPSSEPDLWINGSYATQGAVADLFTNYTVAPRVTPVRGGNYQPLNTATAIKNRVPAGKSILKYDIAGNLRKTDGTGAAGAYEAAP